MIVGSLPLLEYSTTEQAIHLTPDIPKITLESRLLPKKATFAALDDLLCMHVCNTSWFYTQGYCIIYIYIYYLFSTSIRQYRRRRDNFCNVTKTSAVRAQQVSLRKRYIYITTSMAHCMKRCMCAHACSRDELMNRVWKYFSK
jgi:hypothetical protein